MNFFFGFVSALPGPFLGKYRDRRTETSPVPSGKDSSPSRKVLQYSPKKTGVLPEKDWKRIRNCYRKSVYTLSQIQQGTISSTIYHNCGCYPSTMPIIDIP